MTIHVTWPEVWWALGGYVAGGYLKGFTAGLWQGWHRNRQQGKETK